jgi:hypothetical protein
MDPRAAAERRRLAAAEAAGPTELSSVDIMEAYSPAVLSLMQGTGDQVKGVAPKLKEEIVAVPRLRDIDRVSEDPFERPIFQDSGFFTVETLRAKSQTRSVKPGELITVHGNDVIGGPLILPHRPIRCLLMEVVDGEQTGKVIGDVTIAQGGELAWTDGISSLRTPASAALVVHPEEKACDVTFVPPLHTFYDHTSDQNAISIEEVDKLMHNLAVHFANILERQNAAVKDLGFHFKPAPYTSITDATYKELEQSPGAVEYTLEEWTAFLPHQIDTQHPSLEGPKLMIASTSAWVVPYSTFRAKLSGSDAFLYCTGQEGIGALPDNLRELAVDCAVGWVCGDSPKEQGRTAIFEMYGLETHDKMEETPPAVLFPSRPGGKVLAIPMPDFAHPDERLNLRRLAAQELIKKATTTAATMTEAANKLAAKVAANKPVAKLVRSFKSALSRIF